MDDPLTRLAQDAEKTAQRVGGPWGPSELEAIRQLFDMLAALARIIRDRDPRQ